MRRKDKEITDKQVIEKILNEAEIIRLAMVDNGNPYLVAMNFVYTDDCLYMHSAKEGRKINTLRECNKVAFQVDTGAELILKEEACGCSARYMSVFGSGMAILIDEKAEKAKALDAIMTKYTGRARFEYNENVFDRTLVIKVEIELMTGKKSGY